MRTNCSASSALTVLAKTAIAMPNTGPNNNPAASVNAVRGNGATVMTMCAARNAHGNHGPSDSAQSRICTGAGRGTHDASARRPVIKTTVARTRGWASWRVAEPIAKARSRRVPRILPVAGSVTDSKATAFHDEVVDQLA
jgi:hypothetical protein